jgi:hypothetical protein
MQAEQFVKAHHHDMLMVETDADSLLGRFSGYRATAAKQWLGKDEI